MLILTRRVGESLMIGDDVTITVLGVKGNQVRIGVKAPKEVAVHREEILNRIEKASGESLNEDSTLNLGDLGISGTTLVVKVRGNKHRQKKTAIKL